MNGLALSPAEDARVRARVMELSSKVPVVTFNTDLPESGRLCYVGPDNYAFGRASASPFTPSSTSSSIAASWRSASTP